MLKDYLNNSETKEMIVLSQARNLINHFVDGNVMTKEEKTSLKKASTFLKNGLISLNKRLGEQQAKKFVRLNEGSRVIVITNSELEVLQKRKVADLKAAFEDSKEYFDLVEITMDLNCKDCNKCFKECDLYKHFEEQEVIPFDEEVDLGNCKFAYRK
ncbi:DUF5651 domain-containing protein [Clostridium beijerinckii]|uniref:DUF5651 domain-containing protein n=1 Tax=Clostridium beijerinckii TaxID=1520 RepID=A0A7X9SQP0_CLOBE|nr:DUF5651 domain-containing protein [Clostridium beijerinckii]NMF06278.1 hypothetical protein [Clostridium beijerinckii]